MMPTVSEHLRSSPLDQLVPQAKEPSGLVQIDLIPELDFVPSHYNAHTDLPDGRTLLWNTCAGTINAFGPEVKPHLSRMLSQKGFHAPMRGLAKYLYDRGYVVPKGTDEYRRVQVLIGQQHYRTDTLELILLASEDCNFRCVYCYEDFPRGTMVPAVRERVKKLVTKKISRLDRLSISWFGGEPLYGYEAIEDLAPFFVEISKKHGVSYDSNMTTNGYLLSRKTADQLLGWQINNFQITLDGIGAVHDSKRPARDGSPSFSTIMDNLLSLRARKDDFKVSIRVNFDRGNRSEIEELLALLNGHFGGDSRFGVGLHAVGRWGGSNDANLDVCGVDEAEEVRRQLTTSEVGKDLRVQTLVGAAGLGKQVCYAARPFNFIVGADGKLMKCTVVLDKEDYNIVGRLGDDGDLLIDVDKMAGWVEPAFERDRGCQKCYLLPACQGMHCPLVRIQTNTAPCPGGKTQLQKELVLAAHKSAALEK